MLWVPQMGLGEAVGAPDGAGESTGCCYAPRNPSHQHAAGQCAGSRNVVNFTMKNPELHETVVRA